MIGIVQVKPTDIDAVWPHISDRIIKCADAMDGDLSPVDLLMMVRTGQAFLFVAMDEAIKGAAVARFERWHSGVVFNCLMMVGEDMNLWKDAMIKTAAEQARSGGATRLAWTGREGWRRENRDYGAKVAAFIMTMEI